MPPAGRAAALRPGTAEPARPAACPLRNPRFTGTAVLAETPRASCPWCSAHTPQEIPGGVWASARTKKVVASLRNASVAWEGKPYRRVSPPKPSPSSRGVGPRCRGSRRPGRSRSPRPRPIARPPRPSSSARPCGPARWRGRPPAIEFKIDYYFTITCVFTRNYTCGFPAENRGFAGFSGSLAPVYYGTIAVPGGHRAGSETQWPRGCGKHPRGLVRSQL